MTTEQIRWGCIQPLTGGMYLGAEKAIGHAADWIISYPGLTDYVYDKNNNVIDAVNERNIFEYLKKHDRLPNWYLMNRGYLNNDEMLNDTELKPEYTLHPEEAGQNRAEQPDITNMDIVVAVPVCAGLSMASHAAADRKDQCNAQMIWMAKYVMKTIRPKIYIFENAPTLMSDRGNEVRDQLETIAFENGYSTIYYKTDTKLHDNCQRRPRTFIYFVKNRNGEKFIPEFKYYQNKLTVEEFFNNMPALREDDPMAVTIENSVNVEIPLKYVQYKYGDDWRTQIHGDIHTMFAYDHDERQKFIEWMQETQVDERDYKWFIRLFKHMDEKLAEGKGWWSTSAKYFNNHLIPACMYKNVPTTLHYKENRLLTMREWLYTMGHPTDFDMAGEPKNYFCKIGQNVPANTAKWILLEACRIIQEWDTLPSLYNGQNVAFFDNTKQKQIW